eukprot:8091528-Pyramimonas_sp.AAC.1
MSAAWGRGTGASKRTTPLALHSCRLLGRRARGGAALASARSGPSRGALQGPLIGNSSRLAANVSVI